MKIKINHANQYIQEGNYDLALQIYKEIKDKDPLYPKIDFFIEFCTKKINTKLNYDPKLDVENINITNHNVQFENLSLSKKDNLNIFTDKKWVAVITLWKRKEYFAEQLKAIHDQSIPPIGVIVILNDKSITSEYVKSIDQGIQVIDSDINSLYTRWFAGYLSDAEYVNVFDDDVIPGSDWIMNALRVCDQYNALVGSAGRIYNKNGHKDFFELVTPNSETTKNKFVNCSHSDVYCDWICNSYFFKTEWISSILKDLRYKHTQKTFDDIQLSVSLQMYAGVNCIVPYQPIEHKNLWGSLKSEYGNDDHAIWKTNQDDHFKGRKKYIEELIFKGYKNIRDREELHRLILIIPYIDYELLVKCLMTLKAQTYRNYIAVIVDDSQFRQVKSLDLARLHIPNLVYVKTNEPVFGLAARIIAEQVVKPRLSDVIVHLDGDDMLSDPEGLKIIADAYAKEDVLLTYGGGFSYYPKEFKSFWDFNKMKTSKKWGFSDQSNIDEYEYDKVNQSDIYNDDWRSVPWGAFHLRTFKFIQWLKSSKDHLKIDGDFLRIATDAAIFLPVLNNTSFKNIKWIDKYIYNYRNGENSIHFSDRFTAEYRAGVKKHLTHAKIGKETPEKLLENIFGRSKYIVSNSLYKEVKVNEDLTKLSGKNYDDSKTILGVSSVITKNYLADGLTAVLSSAHYSGVNCRKYLYVSDLAKAEEVKFKKLLKNYGITILTINNVILKNYSNELANKYGDNTDEFRWAMKSVILMEMIERGCSSAIFVDPDLFTTANISDVVKNVDAYKASVFPHFRDPDDDYLRKVLYRDGFFNGGLIGINKAGYDIAKAIYVRCMNEMCKDPDRNRWDDQKYFDLIVLENEGVIVNQDRGIDYNPWNYEPVDGLLSPNIRSFFLSSGFFVRNWHVSTNMIKQSIDKHERHYSHLIVCYIYLCTLFLHILILLFLTRKNKILHNFGLIGRCESIRRNLQSIVWSNEITVYFSQCLSLVMKDVETFDDSIFKQYVIKILSTGVFKASTPWLQEALVSNGIFSSEELNDIAVDEFNAVEIYRDSGLRC